MTLTRFLFTTLVDGIPVTHIIESAAIPVENRSPEAAAWLAEVDAAVQTPEFWDIKEGRPMTTIHDYPPHEQGEAVNLDSIKSVVIYTLGLISVIIGAIPAVSVPSGVHVALVSIGGVLLAVERYLQGQIAVAKAAK